MPNLADSFVRRHGSGAHRCARPREAAGSGMLPKAASQTVFREADRGCRKRGSDPQRLRPPAACGAEVPGPDRCERRATGGRGCGRARGPARRPGSPRRDARSRSRPIRPRRVGAAGDPSRKRKICEIRPARGGARCRRSVRRKRPGPLRKRRPRSGFTCSRAARPRATRRCAPSSVAKGAGLAEMTNAGLPVPPGFTITTAACNAFFKGGGKLPPGLWDQVERALATVERHTKKRLGDPRDPLLVSVRSGAAMSMPGMMDTVLNLGLNDESRQGLATLTKNERFAWDAYRRFISMFGRIVLDIPAENFDAALEKLKHARGAKSDTELAREGPRRAGRRVQGHRQKEDRKAVSGRAAGPAPPRGRGRLRLLVWRAREGLPEAVQDLGRSSARRAAS